jgi:polyisoprenoid-binding protein YceI
MKRLVSSLIVVLISTALFAQTTWKVDPMHSKLLFTITHLGIADITGQFKKFEVTVSTNKADFSDGVFEFSADIASIDTEVEMRDNHLKSPDFFEAEKFPKMTFKSTSITNTGKDKYKLTGDLTIRGVTKPVTMDLWYRGTTEHPQSKAPVAGFQLTGFLKRSDFNIGAKFPAPMLSDEVMIRADGEFAKK